MAQWQGTVGCVGCVGCTLTDAHTRVSRGERTYDRHRPLAARPRRHQTRGRVDTSIAEAHACVSWWTCLGALGANRAAAKLSRRRLRAPAHQHRVHGGATGTALLVRGYQVARHPALACRSLLQLLRQRVRCRGGLCACVSGGAPATRRHVIMHTHESRPRTLLLQRRRGPPRPRAPRLLQTLAAAGVVRARPPTPRNP